jgi:predicted secreted protein
MSVLKALGSSITWNAVAVTQCKSIDGPAVSIATEKTTNMDSAGGKDTFLPTTVDQGKITLEIEFDPDDVVHKALIADCEGKTPRAFVITETDPTPTTRSGTGIIATYDIKREFAGVLLMSVSIQVSGAIVHA